jgi:hypothetical protein
MFANNATASGTAGGVASTITVVPGVTFQQCLGSCDAACAFVNYNHDTADCQVVRPDTGSST